MQPQKIDLRRYNITDQNSMLEFLELFINKAPQMVRVMKKLQLENQSLRNHVDSLRKDNQELTDKPLPIPMGDNISVSDRLAGKTITPTGVSAQERLKQMAAAEGSEGTVDELPDASADTTLLPKAAAGPGDIGVAPPAPMSSRQTAPTAPELPPSIEGQEPPAEIVDDDPAGEVTTDDIGELDLGGGPSAEDVKGVGDRIAEKQQSEKPLKSFNRTELNARAIEVGISDPEKYVNNRKLREAITAKQNATDN